MCVISLVSYVLMIHVGPLLGEDILACPFQFTFYNTKITRLHNKGTLQESKKLPGDEDLLSNAKESYKRVINSC